MASATYMTMQLLLVATYFCQPSSSETIGLSTPLTTKAAEQGFLAQFALDEAIWESFAEAAIALAVFGIASGLIGQYRKRTRKPVPASKVKAVSVPAAAPWKPRTASERAANPKNPTVAAGQRSPAGLKPPAPATKVSETDALVSAVRAGKASRLPELLDAALVRSLAAVARLEAPPSDEEVATHLLLSALRSCAASRCFKEAVAAYEHFAGRVGIGNTNLWSVLLYNLVEAGAFQHCRIAVEKLCQHACPSENDFVNMVRCHAGSHDHIALKELLCKIRSFGHSISAYTLNRSMAACAGSDSAPQLADILAGAQVCLEALDAVGYNTLMKFAARAGNISRCFELRTEMLAKGLEASEVTFGILLDACVTAKELDRARQVFDDLCASGLKLNVVHCTTFIKVLAGAGRLDEAAGVLHTMVSSPGVKPDLITYSTLVKAYSEGGDVSSAMKILELMLKEGTKADEIIFHGVLTGCSTFPLKSTAVMRVVDTLVGHGMKASTTTLSILLKGLALTEAWSLSLDVLKDSPKKFALEPEDRLFAQLAQSCIKSRDTVTVLEVFEAMAENAGRRGRKVDAAIVDRFLRTCILGGKPAVAAKLRDRAQQLGMGVSADAHVLAARQQRRPN